ncbi:fucolectin-5-like [Oncorhynchus tshawytscha]|uniref:fucolectin-5-like n=1 Tax=Oncorhynchus tshawytscha TaxID=74940 RepID=UPI000D09A925|nr:fucolectin-5-like [Oncorhynchus tshawytscha]
MGTVTHGSCTLRLNLTHGSDWTCLIHTVFFITITNRIDCCSRRLNGAEIWIGDSVEDNNGNNPRRALVPSVPERAFSTFHCNGMEGQYINVVIPGRNEFLTLCEVESYGAPLD